MPQSLSRVYLHITFSTKNRKPLINNEISNRLFDYIGGICKGLECNPVKIGGYKDHVHVLCTLSRKITQSTLLEQLKKQSSKWIKTIDCKYSDFYWQRGYGIFSVDYKGVDNVVEYILNQKKHHKVLTFQEEFKRFLIENDIDYDERYVWD